jgi:hypothetical protein
MAVIKFYTATDDKLVGTVTATDSGLTGDSNGVREMVDGWKKSPAEFITAYADWGNGYLYSKEQGVDSPDGS